VAMTAYTEKNQREMKDSSTASPQAIQTFKTTVIPKIRDQNPWLASPPGVSGRGVRGVVKVEDQHEREVAQQILLMISAAMVLQSKLETVKHLVKQILCNDNKDAHKRK